MITILTTGAAACQAGTPRPGRRPPEQKGEIELITFKKDHPFITDF